VYSFLVRPRWIGLVVLVVATVVASVLLSQWQFSRGEEREARNDLVRANIDQQPVTPDDLLVVGQDLPDELQWRNVAVSGRYDEDATRLVRKRTFEGRPGFYVLTPIVGENDVALWVNRGWIPNAATAVTAPEVPAAPAGTVTAIVRMRPSEDPSGIAIGELPDGQVDKIDVAALSEERGGPTYGGFGELVEETPATQPAPSPLDPPSLSSGPHVSYAFQWLTLGLIAIVGYVILARTEVQRRRADADEQQDGVDPDLEDEDGGAPPAAEAVATTERTS
jgi:cytochrome oxidase assembly protein ShyY1